MPELPDVEGFKRYFNRHGAGRRIEGVDVPDRMMLRSGSGRTTCWCPACQPRR